MKKLFRIVLFLILIAGGIFLLWGYPAYKAIFAPNVPSGGGKLYVYIPTGADYEEVVANLSGNNLVVDESSFRRAAGLMRFDRRQTMRAGRFELRPGMNNRELIQLLRAGKQAPIRMTISYGRLPEDVASKAASYIEADSLAILSLFRNENFLSQHNLTLETAISRIIPNTYEFFWNTDEMGFWKRMDKEHKVFWNGKRLAKAKEMGMTPEEIYTLASIVEAETKYNPEKARVAGVYMNRLEKGMLLQADPTLVFATRDFDTRRVLDKHKEFDSPYNTYMYAGLPPGPIMLASISSIDAVLDYEDHGYYYFCAKPPSDINEKPKAHAFAKTLAQHNANAKRYYAYLRRAGIR